MQINSSIKLLAIVFELLISLLLINFSLDKLAIELGFVQIIGMPMGVAFFAYSKSGRALSDLTKFEVFFLFLVLGLTLFSLPSFIDPLNFLLTIIMFVSSFFLIGKKKNFYFSRYIFNLFFLRSFLIFVFIYLGYDTDYLLLTSMALLLLASILGEREALFDRPKEGISFTKQFLLSYVQGLLLYVGYWYVANYNFDNSSEFRMLLQVTLLPLVFQQVSNQTNFNKIIIGSIVSARWLIQKGSQAAKYSFFFISLILLSVVFAKHNINLISNFIDAIEAVNLVYNNLILISVLYIMILFSVLLGPLGLFYRLNISFKVNLYLILPLLLLELLVLFLAEPTIQNIVFITVLFMLAYNILMFLRIKLNESANGSSAPQAKR